MGRILKHGSLFLLVTTVLYMAAMFLLGHLRLTGTPFVYRTSAYYTWPGGTTWQSMRGFDKDKNWNVIVVGSSHAYRGYDPYIFIDRGYSCYNLGSSAQTPMNSYYIIKDLLNRENTGLLVLDVYEGTFNIDGLESTSDLVRNFPSQQAALGMAWSLRDLRGLNLMAQRVTTPNAPAYDLDPDYAGLGFTPKTDSVGEPLLPDTVPAPPINPRQVYFFKEVVRLCAERGIPLVVSSHYGRKGYSPGRNAAFKACIDGALDGSGVPYLDYTESPGVSDLDNFADNDHLNLSGARIFTRNLVDSLEALKYLERK